LKPFRVIWDRDKTQGKLRALQELAFIYFFCDPRSDYMFIINVENRKEKIIEQEGMKSSWKPDKQILSAMELYRYLTQTTSS
jgi:hypothetical protein